MTRKGRLCQVCAHGKRHSIELALAYGIGCKQIAERFPPLHWKAIWRHGKNHLSPVQRAAMLVAMKPSDIDLEALTRSESEGLLANLIAVRSRLLKQSEIAMAMGAPSVAIAAEAQIMANLALVGKLIGSLVTTVRHDHSINLLLSPDWLRVRAAILEALRKHPDAALDVSKALHAIEAECASELEAQAATGKRPRLLIDASAAEAQPC